MATMNNTETTNMSPPVRTSCSDCVGGIKEYMLWKLLLASANRAIGSDPEGIEAWNEAMLDAFITLNVRAILQAGRWRILGNPKPFFLHKWS